MDRVFMMSGAILGFLGVAAGAFGAHGMKGKLDEEMLAVFETGARYQMYHAIALLAVAWATTRWPGGATTAAGWLFIAGTVVFSGTLYILSLTGVKWWGAVTPFGGLMLLAGWAALAWGAYR